MNRKQRRAQGLRAPKPINGQSFGMQFATTSEFYLCGCQWRRGQGWVARCNGHACKVLVFH